MERIPLGCKAFDDMLGGGFESGSLTLLYGEGGCGKTNICLQMARNLIDSKGKKVAYLDSEGLSMDRMGQILGDRKKDVLIFGISSFEEQTCRIEKLEALLDKGILGLIIVDSMTMFYRLNMDDPGARNELITQTAMLLNYARIYDVPVLITSQVYSNLQTGAVEYLGGHAMTHNAKTIIRLEKRGNGARNSIIVKHRSLPDGRRASYRISDTGIEDI